MVKLTVLYGHPTDPGAFEKYYAQTHLALVAKMSALARSEFAKVVGTPDGQRPEFYRIAELWFDSQHQMQATLGSPEGQATVGDLPNFATGGVTILVSEID